MSFDNHILELEKKTRTYQMGYSEHARNSLIEWKIYHVLHQNFSETQQNIGGLAIHVENTWSQNIRQYRKKLYT